MPDTTLDDETTAALTLFNEYVIADRERTQREKKIKKAERAKDEAAAAVKKLADKGSAEEKAEAEKAYHQALETWKALRDGKEPPKPENAQETTAEAAPAEEAPRTDDAAEPEPAADPESAGEDVAAPADDTPEASSEHS